METFILFSLQKYQQVKHIKKELLSSSSEDI